MRQPEPVLRSYSVVHPPGAVRLPSQPDWQQLLWAGEGGLVARTAGERWTVPPGRLLVIPPEVSVQVVTSLRRTPVRCLYLGPTIARTERGVGVLEPTPFGAALFHQAVDVAPVDGGDEVGTALITLLLAELVDGADAPLSLQLPSDPRSQAVAERILADPAGGVLAAVDGVAASRRTIERLFRAELGVTPARWQRRARVLLGLELLGTGESVTRTAALVGYSTPSAFTHAFTKELGSPPRHAVASAGRVPEG